jgi:hypothetical protein
MNLADAREQALAHRATNAEKQWSKNAKALPPLKVGDTVMVQNQVGNHPLRWDKRGTIIKCEGFDQYQLMLDGSRRLTPFQPPQAMLGGDARSAPPKAGAVKPAVSKPASQPHRDYLVTCSKMSSATRDMNKEVARPRFQGNMVINISKVLTKENMGVMSINHCKTVRSRAQSVTSWNGPFQQQQTTKIKTMRDLHMMKLNQLGCNIEEMSVKSKCHRAQVRGDQQEQEEGRLPSTKTLLLILKLPLHMPR